MSSHPLLPPFPASQRLYDSPDAISDSAPSLNPRLDADEEPTQAAHDFAWFSQALEEEEEDDDEVAFEELGRVASSSNNVHQGSVNHVGPSSATDSKEDITYRFAYCAEKAGMAGTMSKVASTILEISRDSAYYRNEERKSAANDAKIAKLRDQVAALPPSTLERAQAAAEKWIRDLETSRNLESVIVHLDMDAYYCSVEELDNPDLKGKPFGVGGMSMLSTANYEARKYGVRAAMPGYMAKKLCPDLIIVPMHFDRYRELSRKIRAILRRFDPNMQPLGLDENYINLTPYLKDHGLTDPQPVVQEIRDTIQRETKLTASAGISCNKLLSKIGSDINKPNGQFYLPPTRDAILDFMRPLPVRKVWGVGKVSERTLVSLGINTCADIIAHAGLLSLVLSEKGYQFLIPAALGIGSTNVKEHIELQKSMSSERTFSPATTPPERWSEILVHLIDTLIHDLAKHNALTRHVSVKVKTDGFLVRQAGRMLPKYTNVASDLEPAAALLLRDAIQALRDVPCEAKSATNASTPAKPGSNVRLRLIGVKLSELVDATEWNQRGLHRFFGKQKVTMGDGEASQGVSPNHQVVDLSSSPPPSSLPDRPLVPPSTCSDVIASLPAGDTPAVCPVCRTYAFPPDADNTVVNSHVDECLTRMRLAEERAQRRLDQQGHEPDRPDLKRSRSEDHQTTAQASNKRKRKAAKVERTLHDFF